MLLDKSLDLSTDILTLPAPAKINHFLHIVGQREDGYHLLQTLFQFLDYGDELRFERRQDNKIVIFPQNMLGIPDEANLVYRAARALQPLSEVPQGVTIWVEKRVGPGTGLGLGSSNAATTLFALNALWALNLPQETLMRIGNTLGADVPIFLYGHAAWAQGTGDVLAHADLEEPWIVVVLPACQVATAKMYAHSDLTRNTPAFKIGPRAKSEMNNLLSSLKNDFEPVVRRCYPEVDDAMAWLSNYAKARLSGSGASVFACFSAQDKAQAVIQCLPQRFKGFIAKGTNFSPLMSAAEKYGLKFNDWGVAKR